MNRVVVFDLDGTLVELAVAIEDARAEVEGFFARHGVSGHCRPLLPTAAAWAAQCSDTPQTLLRQALEPVAAAERRAASSARPCPGAATAMTRLVAAGYGLAVLTNNHSSCVVPALAAAGLEADAFAVVRGRDQVPAKPDPRGLLSILAELSVPPSDAWFVGNGCADIEAGVSAGVRTVGVTVDSRNPAGLAGRGAHALVESVEQAVDIILR